MQEGSGCCCVCAGRGAPRYRCPGCRARYCSVPCYKKHKEQCIAKQDQVVKTLITDTSSLFRRVKPGQGEGSHWSVDDILTEDDEVDRVPLQKLKLLGESKELRSLLLNPHLQQLLLTVDQAKEKDSLMKTYMQEPLFVEFADRCLRVIEPPEKENCLLD
ncbi:zinc finger HIT domain-containing protein 3 isoform X1 [Terrapene carolina triunguis]|uniref:Zinc finger HIT domain-containing protein 3 n=1 Tax=Terrapene triunguis TaxID=2587831 RepID=A0A674KDD9_9SAUR|nr:zinc finger HIT domain-containing protein 3 isoform X1 [Terrapene carolina triunguis]